MDSPSALRRKDTMTTRGPPLRILSLDGGGVRGFSTILILEELMQRVVSVCDGKPPENIHSVKPCDYFDLIAGVGTGGLIAIMLGRLRMTLRQCREIYIEMTKVVFETDKTIAGIPYRSTLFKASKLEDAIRACVQDYEHEKEGTIHGPPGSPTRPGSMYSYKNSLPRRRSSLSNYGGRHGSFSKTSLGNPNAPMYDSRPHRTRTAVSCILKGTRGGTSVLLRSYPSQTQRTIESDCTIWQAGRATCATGLAFKPIQIGTSVFQDQGSGHFNPSIQVLDEAVLNEWPGRRVGLFVSVGCGKRASSSRDGQREWWEGMAGEFAEAKRRLISKIDGCEKTHQEMIGNTPIQRMAGEKERPNENPSYLELRGVPLENYIRLNVDKGVGDLAMNEWNQLPTITGNTQSYLNDPKVKDIIERGAERMWEVQTIREGGNPYSQRQSDIYEDSAPAYGPPPPDPNAVELPGEDPPSLYPRPLSKPGPQYPATYLHPFEQPITPQDKFTIISSDVAPQAVDISPRLSEEGSFRPSSELYGSDRPLADNPRISSESVPPPLPPKTPMPYYESHQHHALPYRTTNQAPLPYPDTDGPPPVVNMARKPQFVHR